MKERSGKCVFVTVGTTLFDKLIQSVTNESVMQVLSDRGYSKVVMQIGRGKYTPNDRLDDHGYPSIEHFDMKDTISEDIRLADLVISHAGAGSILEALEARRPLIVVINEDLMGNHQTELAGKLAELGHLTCCKCSSLEETLRTFDSALLQPLEPGNPARLSRILDELMGFS